MTRDELLERALRYSATIHQPHAIKAYLAAKNVFPFIPNPYLWEQVDNLIAQSEIYNAFSFSKGIDAPKFSPVRISRILNRGIFPAAYAALNQWYRSEGFKSITDHYMKLAASNNEYLSHNITILLSFKELESQIEGENLYLFLDRVTEFVTSTFNTPTQLPIEYHDQSLPNELLLEKCLLQPSFFGHNLITLAWLMRSETDIPSDLLKQFKHHLYIQTTTPLEDPDDELDHEVYNLCPKGDSKQFMINVENLVFGACQNLHQITLADSLLYLQQKFPEYTPDLARIADYQVRVLK